MNFNLIDKLTEEDKAKIEKYIEIYGTKKDFIGLDNWLKYWSLNKIKMYKLLNNQFIYQIPFEYNKSSCELNNQLVNLVHESEFIELIKHWVNEKVEENIFISDILQYIYSCCYKSTFIANEVPISFKFKLEDANKMLQLQKGMAPIRALSRFLTYCKNVEGADKIIKAFEKFRIDHSMILNDKFIKGKLTFSIHPLDFMTMSDNDSNWQSCMSWRDGGCYKVGTIEMMNSNNVLCCYIENSKPFYFSKDKEEKEEYKWHNKKWRQLVYFNKDIIVSGKPYPYTNDEISKIIISTIRDLAKNNLGWKYSFGPELYKDMQYINSSFSMNRAKNYIRWGDMRKHNILFDTKGMYNDMLNDSSTKYWCIRNKVNHNKVISYSGKAPCLCCGNEIIYPSYEDYDYNERYMNCGSTVCEDCLPKFKCDFCSQSEPNKVHYKVFLKGKENEDISADICEDCVRDYIRKCPDCNSTMFVRFLYGRYNIFSDEELDYPENYIKLTDKIEEEEFDKDIFYLRREKIDDVLKTIYPICRCGKCASKDNSFEIKRIERKHCWGSVINNFLISKKVEDKKKWEKYFPFNLEPVEVGDGEVITN